MTGRFPGWVRWGERAHIPAERQHRAHPVRKTWCGQLVPDDAEHPDPCRAGWCMDCVRRYMLCRCDTEV